MPALAAKYGDALLKVYQHLDRGGAASASAGRAVSLNTIIMSDHGFGPLHRTINLNILFIEKGLMHLKPKFFTQLRWWAFRNGLTPATAYKILSKLGLQNITAKVSRKARNEMVGKFLSFEDVDWSKTIAYSMGHVGQIYHQPAGTRAARHRHTRSVCGGPPASDRRAEHADRSGHGQTAGRSHHPA